jgi:hypothetical protein
LDNYEERNIIIRMDDAGGVTDALANDFMRNGNHRNFYINHVLLIDQRLAQITQLKKQVS